MCSNSLRSPLEAPPHATAACSAPFRVYARWACFCRAKIPYEMLGSRVGGYPEVLIPRKLEDPKHCRWFMSRPLLESTPFPPERNSRPSLLTSCEVSPTSLVHRLRGGSLPMSRSLAHAVLNFSNTFEKVDPESLSTSLCD